MFCKLKYNMSLSKIKVCKNSTKRLLWNHYTDNNLPSFSKKKGWTKEHAYFLKFQEVVYYIARS